MDIYDAVIVDPLTWAGKGTALQAAARKISFNKQDEAREEMPQTNVDSVVYRHCLTCSRSALCFVGRYQEQFLGTSWSRCRTLAA